MRYKHGARQIYVRAEPTFEDRDEIERAIALEEEFQNWARQRHRLELATIHLESRRYLVDVDTHSGVKQIRQDVPLDDYVDSCLEEAFVLYDGPRWEEC